MEKAADAFRTISEVSIELNLPQYVLRFWETKFNRLRPLKRAGGRRYYRPEDLALLRHIQTLLYDEGYTIKGVQRILRRSGLSKEALRQSELSDGDHLTEDMASSLSKKSTKNDVRNAIKVAILELETARNMLKD
ncbi:MAG: hypothetical protein CBB68_03850 [Rhodospirillaceae bacterium TMED8]|nr:MerR family transcriptional regulator [Magnetovibrio sp.]OUT52011.1 MAG: hypothetical protein CBB68_03850 [Rhodospirillaceae bacterium TMED8]